MTPKIPTTLALGRNRDKDQMYFLLSPFPLLVSRRPSSPDPLDGTSTSLQAIFFLTCTHSLQAWWALSIVPGLLPHGNQPLPSPGEFKTGTAASNGGFSPDQLLHAERAMGRKFTVEKSDKHISAERSRSILTVIKYLDGMWRERHLTSVALHP